MKCKNIFDVLTLFLVMEVVKCLAETSKGETTKHKKTLTHVMKQAIAFQNSTLVDKLWKLPEMSSELFAVIIDESINGREKGTFT